MRRLVFSSALVLLTVAATVLVMKRSAAPAFNPPAILTQIQRLNNLVTVRYSIQRVVGLTEPKVPFGSESILLMVQGEAQAGIDLKQIKTADLQLASDGSVTVTLPRAKLMNVFLDEKQIKVWDRSITWWTPWVPYDPDLEHRARLQALDDVRSTALQMGILGQAQRNAESSIRDLLSAVNLRATYSGD